MRLVSVRDGGRAVAAVVDGPRILPLDPAATGVESMRALAAAGQARVAEAGRWAAGQAPDAWIAAHELELMPVMPDPGAIYTIGLNYRATGEPEGSGPERPLVYGKAPTSVVGDEATITWDRSLTPNVDGEVELGVVVGAGGTVFGYTVMNDVSSRDPWLDGDQWLLGKSMPGFCPVGPMIVTPDELDPADLALRCTINGDRIQDGRTSAMRFPIPALLAFLARHLDLRPGDLIATGTPPRLATPPGPDRHLEPGDVVTCWIEGIGTLRTTIA